MVDHDVGPLAHPLRARMILAAAEAAAALRAKQAALPAELVAAEQQLRQHPELQILARCL